ncbi:MULTISPECIES: hypothetical protein [Francisella]|uniref:hypothetical protein n=1 Tax=Francisella TaxID=262 RepID=UPI000158B4F5|nr:MULTISPECIES: hypothetical protein [Francisella]AEE88162.1 hypothetical protein FNFX1_1777 [Francisella cf. novicida Fx1]AJI73808.1 hypothetical protein AQ14_911 [Francisella tularensis subsp. novicida D9876]APC95449.1 hypothetical protein KX02_1776 [Francisella tularensis subsp. novicida]EDN38477.1 conserved hypothetical protein [Francisella tularensis subsp. novicida GA99-3548]MBK2111881.1 hypothetical protein [Francisella tularensis subsp. novicida FSC159]
MSLINMTKIDKKNKVPVHLELDKSVLDEILEYLKWAEIEDEADFIEQACRYIFDIDEDWKKFKKNHFEATGIKLVDKKETKLDVFNEMVGEDEGMVNLEDDENLGNKLAKKLQKSSK